MKKIILVVLSLSLALICFSLATSADSVTNLPSDGLPQLTITEVKAKISKKETFYLLVGREDNVDTQLAQRQVQEAQSSATKPIYFLSTKGMDSKTYKAFTRKYNIRIAAHLATFSDRKQTSVYDKEWTNGPALVEFLTSL
ncbi:hypothetical protein ACVR05_01620 [Streptococcus caprae]|uniref:Uncharacterized protein n=1 Tax=Streptococcus caprae TaxID=1640501 RepID=A0ABV8CWP5_9STRE